MGFAHKFAAIVCRILWRLKRLTLRVSASKTNYRARYPFLTTAVRNLSIRPKQSQPSTVALPLMGRSSVSWRRPPFPLSRPHGPSTSHVVKSRRTGCVGRPAGFVKKHNHTCGMMSAPIVTAKRFASGSRRLAPIVSGRADKSLAAMPRWDTRLRPGHRLMCT